MKLFLKYQTFSGWKISFIANNEFQSSQNNKKVPLTFKIKIKIHADEIEEWQYTFYYLFPIKLYNKLNDYMKSGLLFVGQII